MSKKVLVVGLDGLEPSIVEPYLPDLGLSRYEQKNAFLPPKAVILRRGRPLWDTLTAAGVPSVVLRCPCTYPPDGSVVAAGKALSQSEEDIIRERLSGLG